MKLNDLVRKRFGRGMLGESSPLDIKFFETPVRHCILYILYKLTSHRQGKVRDYRSDGIWYGVSIKATKQDETI